jgi:hypothetical protein
MRWGKVVLIFQAVVTLILGLVFLSQILIADMSRVSDLKIEVMANKPFSPEDAKTEMIDLRQRYSLASYILLIVSLIELIIIAKLFS